MKYSIGLASLLALLTAESALAQSPAYGQCGGQTWTGATTCVSGWTCVYSNPYYSQCLPGSSAPTTTAQPTTVAPTTVAPTTVAPTTTPPTSTGVPSSCQTPSTVSGYSNAALPDPFLSFSGGRITTKADWTCRRAEISAVVQGYEAGTLPPKPTVSGSISGTTLTVSASFNGKSVSFTNTITYPSGTMPSGGWPLVIALGGGSIPIPAGVATLNYDNGKIGAQDGASSRGKGLFFDLYGSGHTASAMIAWTWGVSRIIDVLEITPTAKINVSKLAVTGCSRNGKGALTIGAFEPRIALTIPQESGSGGDAAWRISKYERDQGSDVQDAVEIVGENVWFSANFNNYVSKLNTLPYDHHSLAAMVAPRGLISFENTDYLWLSGMSSWGAMSATHTVYTALGVPDNHGFQQIGGHSHCAWPTSLTGSLNAFFDKFLLDKPTTNTKYFSTNSVFNGKTYNAATWINWSTPTLT